MTTTTAPTIATPRFFQFRLATLLVVTAWVAVVCAALKAASPPWPSIIHAVCLLSIFGAATTVVFRTGRTRAVAIGYLIFAGGYLLYQNQPYPLTSLWALGTPNQNEPSTLPALVYF